MPLHPAVLRPLSVGNNRRPYRQYSGERRRRDNDDDDTVLDNQDRSSVTSQDQGLSSCVHGGLAWSLYCWFHRPAKGPFTIVGIYLFVHSILILMPLPELVL